MKSTKIVVAFAALATLVASAQAGTIYTDQTSYLAAIQTSGAFTNAFGTNAANWSGGSPAQAYTVTAPGTGGNLLYSNGNFLGVNNANDNLLTTFTSGNVLAVGANYFMTDATDNFAALPVTLTYSDGTVDTFSPTGFTTFRGYVGTGVLTSVLISGGGVNTTPISFASMDNMITATDAVPEPATMLVLGLAAAAAARRRKSK